MAFWMALVEELHNSTYLQRKTLPALFRIEKVPGVDGRAPVYESAVSGRHRNYRGQRLDTEWTLKDGKIEVKKWEWK